MTPGPMEVPADATDAAADWELDEGRELIAFEHTPPPAGPGKAEVVAAPALGHATLAVVRDLIESDAVTTVSTDFFDTLVWRRTLDPLGVFTELGTRLAAQGMLSESLGPRAFGRLRRIAEEQARADRRSSQGDAEVRLAEIYAALPGWVFNDGPREEALQLEIELEREIIVPDLDAVELLAHAAERGKTIVTISDIYFSADQLRQLMLQPQLGSLPFRHVFTSSDHREGKPGKLFDIALAELGCEPVQMVHIGDNPGSDIEPAQERGIRTVFLEKRSKPFEAILEREAMFGATPVTEGKVSPEPHLAVDFGLTALRAKTEHRAEGRSIASGLQAYWRFGAIVIGPVLAGFSEWVHREARALGAERVHCLMREGEFLSQYIDGAAAAVDEPVSTNKLWLSRFVATRAAIGAASEGELERLMSGPAPPTVAGFCRRLDLNVTEIPALAGYADTVLYDPVVRRLVLDAILGDDALRGRIVEEARQLRERVVASVLEAAPGEGPIVVADIGWGGTIQQRLAEILGQAGIDRRVAGLYLMTNDMAALGITRGHRIAGFLMNCGAPDRLSRTVMRAPEILEQSLMPEFGTQVGVNEDLNPVLAESAIPQQQSAEAAAVRAGAFSFQRDYVRYRTVLPGKLVSLADAKQELAAVLTRAVVSPTAEEVSALGGWVHDENYGSQGQAPLVDEHWATKVRHLTPRQLGEQPMDQMYWPFGVAHRVDPDLGDLAAAAEAETISWDATATPLETGKFVARITEGVGFEDLKPLEAEPWRNRHGLSFVSGALSAHQILRLEIVLAERACVMRIDWLEFRLFAQGESEPIVVRIEDSNSLSPLMLANCLVLPANLVLCTGSPALMAFDVRPVTSRIVSRIELEAGFAALPGGPVLPGSSRLEEMMLTQARYDRLAATRTWRMTKPLRDVSRRVARRRR